MLQVNGYVFTKDKRILNNWVCCIGIAFVSTFILSIIVNMLISEVDVVANMFVIVVLACVCIFMF